MTIHIWNRYFICTIIISIFWSFHTDSWINNDVDTIIDTFSVCQWIFLIVNDPWPPACHESWSVCHEPVFMIHTPPPLPPLPPLPPPPTPKPNNQNTISAFLCFLWTFLHCTLLMVGFHPWFSALVFCPGFLTPKKFSSGRGVCPLQKFFCLWEK